MELFKLLGTIAIDSSGAIEAIDETADKAAKSESKISKAFTKVGSAAITAGKTIATGFAAGATAMAGLTTKALNLAGELEQNLGGSEAVYGEYAEKMQEKASEAYKNMGLAASDYLATANKMGALFKGAGFDAAEASELSAEAMQRAADVASIMGISVESAMESIAGAAKGNFTMMDNLGVAMNETNLEAYALSQGIEKAYTEMTQQEKIGLAMEMFLDKTSYATGNYAKENETLAGSLGTAKAALSNFLSGAGTASEVVESVVNAGRVVAENLKRLLPDLVAGLNQLITELLPYLPELINSLLPGIIQGAIALLNGLVAALPTILQILLEQLPYIVTEIGKGLIKAFPDLLNTVKKLFGQIWDYISLELLNTGVSFEDAFAKINEIFEAAWEVCQTIWNTIGQPVFDIVKSGIDKVKKVFEENMPKIRAFFKDAIDGIKDTWENHLKPAFEAIGNFIENVLAPAFDVAFGVIADYVSMAFDTIISAWTNVLKPTFDGICDFVTNVFSGNWEGAWQGIVDTFEAIFGGIKEVAKTPINWVIKYVNKAIEAINGLSFDVPDWVPGIGGEVFGFNLEKIPELAKGGVLERGQIGLLEGTGAEAVVPLENNKEWIGKVAAGFNAVTGDNATLERILEVLLEIRDNMPEEFADTIASMKFEISQREFARLVKAVN